MPLLSGKIQDATLILEFRDTSSRNSFSIRAAEELREFVESKKGAYEAIVFYAPGRVFCSGGNLADYAAMTAANPGRDVNRRISKILDDFSRLAVPTIAVVNGDCLGGGLELLSAFDTVLTSPHALFGFWQRRIALTFGWGGGRRLEKRIGAKKLTQLALSAATFGSLEALRIGLVDAVCVEPLLMSEALMRAKRMRELPKAPVQPLKDWETAEEQKTFESLWWNEEHKAILKAR
jgi:enoyl-CoA hydratase/carnithine racemase